MKVQLTIIGAMSSKYTALPLSLSRNLVSYNLIVPLVYNAVPFNPSALFCEKMEFLITILSAYTDPPMLDALFCLKFAPLIEDSPTLVM